MKVINYHGTKIIKVPPESPRGCDGCIFDPANPNGLDYCVSRDYNLAPNCLGGIGEPVLFKYQLANIEII